MREFEFHWLGGNPKVEIGKGVDEADAFRRLGYGGGAVKALDYVRKLPLKIIPKERSVENGINPSS
jgi:hypothetical protein